MGSETPSVDIETSTRRTGRWMASRTSLIEVTRYTCIFEHCAGPGCPPGGRLYRTGRSIDAQEVVVPDQIPLGSLRICLAFPDATWARSVSEIRACSMNCAASSVLSNG